MIYKFDEPVHLRSDPSLYGRIGKGAFGEDGAYNADGSVAQFVFWDHKDADLVTCEDTADLISVEELSQRRRLFFSAMRLPETRLMRLALRCLKEDGGLDWRDVECIEVFSGEYSGCWGIAFNQYYVYFSLFDRTVESATWRDVGIVDCHWDDMPCSCYLCEKRQSKVA